MNSLHLLPPSASAYADELTTFFWVMTAICAIVAIGIAVFIVYCAVKYRRRDPDELPEQIQGNMKLESAWTVIPAIIFLGMFGWGAKTYFDVEEPPPDTMNVFVVAKQWMFKFEYANGIREINTLHVPLFRNVRVTMISEDVIHDLFVPAFRTKQDILPARYTTIWFRANKAGRFHLFCAEYCGTKHSGMIGWVYAMNPHDFDRWVSQGGGEGSLASTGEKYFHQFGCANCHRYSGHGPGPDLRGLYGTDVALSNGQQMTATETYLRDCITGKLPAPVMGFQNIMPNYTGQLTEDQLLALITYIKAIGPQTGLEEPTSEGNSLHQNYQGEPGITGTGATSIAGSKPDSR